MIRVTSDGALRIVEKTLAEIRLVGISQSGLEGLGIQPIRFRGAGNSANLVLGPPKISQSGLEGLGIQPIRFGGARDSTNQVCRG
jgi:hypothetical protein